MAIGLSPQQIGNIQDDYDGDVVTLRLIPEGCMDIAESRISSQLNAKELGELGGMELARYSICCGPGEVLSGAERTLPGQLKVFCWTGVVGYCYVTGVCLSSLRSSGLADCELASSTLNRLPFLTDPTTSEQRFDLTLQRLCKSPSATTVS